MHWGHPPTIRALAKHEAKTDRCDGDRLGKFQLRGILPQSYLAPPEVRQRRERTRYRMALVTLRTGVKNRIQAILHRLGILHTFSDLFGKAGRRFLETLPLPEGSARALRGYLDVMDILSLSIAEVERWMEENLEEDQIVRLLMTIPGIGLILAHVIRSEIGQIERFPTARHLASYDGLAPMSNDTAGREGPRHCSAACNHVLRWALIEAVHGVQRTKGARGLRLRKLYARLSAGSNPRSPRLRRQRCARTSPVTLWSAAGKPSARPVRNWAVRRRIPILCRAGRRDAGNRKESASGGCPNT